MPVTAPQHATCDSCPMLPVSPFHGDNTGSNPVRDANKSMIFPPSGEFVSIAVGPDWETYTSLRLDYEMPPIDIVFLTPWAFPRLEPERPPSLSLPPLSQTQSSMPLARVSVMCRLLRLA